MTQDLIQHLESHLGKIASGWGGDSPIRVVRFVDQPKPGVVTYVTLGLSQKRLPMPGGREVRQELLISTHDSYSGEAIAGFLMSFAEYIASQDKALLRGDAVGPADPLIPGVRVRAVYASIPVFFDDTFGTYQGTTPPTVLVWLLPLLPAEVSYVNSKGWEAFEDRLEATDVDFWDLDRRELTPTR